MGLKLFLRHAFKGSRQAAFGFAPFKVDQPGCTGPLDTIYLKMAAASCQPVTIIWLCTS